MSKEIVVIYDKDDKRQVKHPKCNEPFNSYENSIKVMSDKDIEQRLYLESTSKVSEYFIELLELYIGAEETALIMQYIKEKHCLEYLLKKIDLVLYTFEGDQKSQRIFTVLYKQSPINVVKSICYHIECIIFFQKLNF